MRRATLGALVALGLVAGLSAAMLPLRPSISVATTALVLVLPVVAGVAVGGFAAGVFGVVAGFLVYDFVFIPPYYTMSVGRAQNWVALGVYVATMLVVARLVSRLDRARARAAAGRDDARRLFELSQLLVADRPAADLLSQVVHAVGDAFGLEGVALLLPGDGGLAVVASAGRPVATGDLSGLAPDAATPVSLGGEQGRPGRRLVALSAAGTPVGLLALTGGTAGRPDRELLSTFANQLALALERVRLRRSEVRAELLEEVDRLRRSLVGAVSHDLRTPLASIKVAATSLGDPATSLSADDVAELARLIDEQADRLDRLVANLLDMTRIQAGVLHPRPEPVAAASLLDATVAALSSSLDPARVERRGLEDLPLLDVDPVLIGQVLANLLENAVRHAPDNTPIIVEGRRVAATSVELAVADAGPGVPPAERDDIFLMFNRREAGGRAGLGLAIVTAFLAAHGQAIRVEEAPGGGARFVFTLPVASAARLPDPAAAR